MHRLNLNNGLSQKEGAFVLFFLGNKLPEYLSKIVVQMSFFCFWIFFQNKPVATTWQNFAWKIWPFYYLWKVCHKQCLQPPQKYSPWSSLSLNQPFADVIFQMSLLGRKILAFRFGNSNFFNLILTLLNLVSLNTSSVHQTLNFPLKMITFTFTLSS